MADKKKKSAPAKESAAAVAVAEAPQPQAAEQALYGAKLRYARITARKARLIADLIRGRGVNDALEVLEFQHKRAASFYSGLVRSAMANALQHEGVNANRLVIRECRADDGPMLQNRMRFRPGPQGRAMPFKKLTSHLTVVLHEREAEPARAAKKKQAATKQASTKQSASKKTQAES